MKKVAYLLIALAFFNVSCSTRKVILSENLMPEDIFYLQDEIQPYTGKCLVYYSNTAIIKEEMSFKKGLLNGQRTSYFKNGQIKHTGHYLNGHMDGKWKGFDEKGKMLYEVEYKDDTLAGKFFSWYPTGVMKEKGRYANNLKTGEWFYYDEAGMIIRKKSL